MTLILKLRGNRSIFTYEESSKQGGYFYEITSASRPRVPAEVRVVSLGVNASIVADP